MQYSKMVRLCVIRIVYYTSPLFKEQFKVYGVDVVCMTSCYNCR